MKKMFKKIISAIVTTSIAAASLCLVTFIKASAATYDRTYRLYFEATSASGTSRYDMTMVYNKNMGDLYFGNSAYSDLITDVNEEGQIFNVCSCIYTGNPISGLLFTLKIRSEGEFESNIIYLNGIAKNINGHEISPNPVTVTTVYIGDVNLDGVIDIHDLTALNSIIIGSSSGSNISLRAADINGDGFITQSDVSMLMQYLIGNINVF